MTDTPVTGQSANQGHQVVTRTHQHTQFWFVGDGATVLFPLDKTPRDSSQVAVYVAGLRLRPADRGTAYDFALNGTTVTMTAAPAGGANVLIEVIAP